MQYTERDLSKTPSLYTPFVIHIYSTMSDTFVNTQFIHKILITYPRHSHSRIQIRMIVIYITTTIDPYK